MSQKRIEGVGLRVLTDEEILEGRLNKLEERLNKLERKDIPFKPIYINNRKYTKHTIGFLREIEKVSGEESG